MLPKISVIVPVYNTGEYLDRCINSIINQSFKEYEIILIDDGSNDGSGKICDKYASEFSFVKTYHQPNDGVSSARNLGIEKSSGEYIAFCDSDDYIDSGFLQHAYDVCSDLQVDLYRTSFLKENRACSQNSFSVDTPNFYSSSMKITADEFAFLLEKEYVTSCWSGLVKRNVIDGIRFDSNMIFGEDVKFIFELLSQNVSLFIDNKCFYHYVNNADGITSNVSIKKCRSIKETYLSLFNFAVKLSNNEIFINTIEKRCAEDIYWTVKMVLHANQSVIKKKRMINILFSEELLVNSYMKYKDERKYDFQELKPDVILLDYYKKGVKRIIRRIKSKI